MASSRASRAALLLTAALWATTGCDSEVPPDGDAASADASSSALDGSLSTSDAGTREDGAAPGNDAAAVEGAATLDDGAAASDARFEEAGASGAEYSQQTTCYVLTTSSITPAPQCPAQACLPAQTKISVREGELKCTESSGCKLPSDPAHIGTSPEGGVYLQGYELVNGGTRVRLWFNNELLRGYSLESFRRKVSNAGARVQLPVDGVMASLELPGSVPEILDYDQGVLRFRITAQVQTLERALAVAPYPCTVGHLPTLCRDVSCSYQAPAQTGTGDPANVVVEGSVRIEQPTP